MGKMTCLGPNIIQVGVGMGEAVNVGVTDGIDVAVTFFVAVASCGKETVSVGDGRT